VDRACAQNGVWRNRQPGIKRALQRLRGRRLRRLLERAAEVDRTVKGPQHNQAWDALTGLVMEAVAGK
jgi:DNA polymerase III delta subunit